MNHVQQSYSALATLESQSNLSDKKSQSVGHTRHNDAIVTHYDSLHSSAVLICHNPFVKGELSVEKRSRLLVELFS